MITNFRGVCFCFWALCQVLGRDSLNHDSLLDVGPFLR